MPELIIAGAGMAGLLAANMLHRRRPTVVEKQPVVPNNHSAVLRFRSTVVGDVLDIPFKKCRMIKDVLPWRNSVADALAYAHKTGGMSRSDRSVTEGLTVSDRWIAPPDLIPRMVNGLSEGVQLATAYEPKTHTPSISTIPMPALMELLDYPGRKNIKFSHRPGVNISALINDCDAYVSLLIPDPQYIFYRLSITGDELIVECHEEHATEHVEIVLDYASELLGINRDRLLFQTAQHSRYAKILPIDEEVRRDFIYWATDKHRVFSLGRFATWRPGLLMDDLVQDIRLIDRWLNRDNRYEAARAR